MGHIWLIGMMGSGKTTTGVLAARILDRPFIDTDAAVMVDTGMTIPELFQESESTFRGAESAAIASAAGQDDAVIATGGGAILAGDNVTIMERTGTIVLLDADAGTIAERVVPATDRPLLGDPDSIERILDERADVYKGVAHHIVSTVGRTTDEVALEVASCVDM
jgi:shikimate kinase